MVNGAALRRQPEPVGDVAPGQGRLPGLVTRKIRDKVTTVRSPRVPLTGGQYEEELSQGPLELGGTPVTRGSSARTRRSRAVEPAHMHDEASIVTGVPGAPGAMTPADANRRGGCPWQSRPKARRRAAVHDETEMLISGSEAVRRSRHARSTSIVVTAYPIRPYDTVMQAIAKKIANGKLVAEYIVAEGEHSQFEIVKHASTVGARVFCGSSGVGWMYAMEAITVTPALRVPMVALVGNRALDDPGAFGVEHSDALSVPRPRRGSSCWIDTSQEALDTTLIAYRVAEGPARVPADRHLGGRRVPHPLPGDHASRHRRSARRQVLPAPTTAATSLLHPDNPITVAPQVNEDWVIEIRRQNDGRSKRAYGVIEEAYADFRQTFGRGPENPWFEEYMTEDADIVLDRHGHAVAAGEGRASGTCAGRARRSASSGCAGSGRSRTSSWPRALRRARPSGSIDRDYSFRLAVRLGRASPTRCAAALYNSEQPAAARSASSAASGARGHAAKT